MLAPILVKPSSPSILPPRITFLSVQSFSLSNLPLPPTFLSAQLSFPFKHPLRLTFLFVQPSFPPNLPLFPIFLFFQPSSPSDLPLLPTFLFFQSISPSKNILFLLVSSPSNKHPLPPSILSIQQTVSVSSPLFILSLQSSSVSRLCNKFYILSKLGYKDTRHLVVNKNKGVFCVPDKFLGTGHIKKNFIYFET